MGFTNIMGPPKAIQPIEATNKTITERVKRCPQFSDWPFLLKELSDGTVGIPVTYLQNQFHITVVIVTLWDLLSIRKTFSSLYSSNSCE